MMRLDDVPADQSAGEAGSSQYHKVVLLGSTSRHCKRFFPDPRHRAPQEQVAP